MIHVDTRLFTNVMLVGLYEPFSLWREKGLFVTSRCDFAQT